MSESIIVRVATEEEKGVILDKYPYTSQVINDIGYIIIACKEKKILGFAFIFKRAIPIPIPANEMFINAIEIFNQADRCKGAASKIVQKCIQIAQNEDCYQVRAYCDIDNVASNRLWYKNHFGLSPVKMPNGNIVGSYVTYIL